MQTIETALIWLGTRPAWDAFAAIGTVAAVFWAMRLADRQSSDARKREAVALKTCLLIAVDARFDLQQLRYAAGTNQQPRVAELHARAVQSLETATRWFADFDLLRLPTSASVEAVLRMRPVLKAALAATQALPPDAASAETIEQPLARLSAQIERIALAALDHVKVSDEADAWPVKDSLVSAVIAEETRTMEWEREVRATARRSRNPAP